jgi:uncharacterized protein DUF4404
MNDNDLRTLLTQLHVRLGSGSTIDEEDRRLLVTLLGDIENVLGKSAPTAPAHTAGLESLAVKFEAEHPALAGTLRRVADALGKAGI